MRSSAGSVATALPRLDIGVFPTPLHRAERLTAALGGDIEILFKREDLSGVGLGGNKIRKLRYILAGALAQGADVVLTMGGVQSNHCSATALSASGVGLECEQFLGGDRPPSLTGNLRLSASVGSTQHFVGTSDLDTVERAMYARADELKAAGRSPFVVPLGGSCALGVVGSLDAVDELCAMPDSSRVTHVVTACGSSGTLASLVLGSWLHGASWDVHGYCVLR